MANKRSLELGWADRADTLGLKVAVETERSGLYVGQLSLSEEEETLLQTLEVPRHHPIRVFHKVCHPQRNSQFFSDDAQGYTFSGSSAAALPLTEPLRKLLARINGLFDDYYNGVLVNIYNDGQDCIGAHADDENELGDSGVVMVVYGQTRKFRIRDKRSGKLIQDVDLPSGTLAWMAGDFQKEFKHEVPKEARLNGRRN